MHGLGGVEMARQSVGGLCRMLRKLLREKLSHQTNSRQEGQVGGNSECDTPGHSAINEEVLWVGSDEAARRD